MSSTKNVRTNGMVWIASRAHFFAMCEGHITRIVSRLEDMREAKSHICLARSAFSHDARRARRPQMLCEPADRNSPGPAAVYAAASRVLWELHRSCSEGAETIRESAPRVPRPDALK